MKNMYTQTRMVEAELNARKGVASQDSRGLQATLNHVTQHPLAAPRRPHPLFESLILLWIQSLSLERKAVEPAEEVIAASTSWVVRATGSLWRARKSVIPPRPIMKITFANS